MYGFSVFFQVHRRIGWALLVDYFDVQVLSLSKDDARKLKPFTNDRFLILLLLFSLLLLLLLLRVVAVVVVVVVVVVVKKFGEAQKKAGYP